MLRAANRIFIAVTANFFALSGKHRSWPASCWNFVYFLSLTRETDVMHKVEGDEENSAETVCPNGAMSQLLHMSYT